MCVCREKEQLKRHILLKAFREGVLKVTFGVRVVVHRLFSDWKKKKNESRVAMDSKALVSMGKETLAQILFRFAISCVSPGKSLLCLHLSFPLLKT